MTSDHNPRHFGINRGLENTTVDREVLAAESHIPDRLHDFLLDLERTRHSTDVWKLLVALLLLCLVLRVNLTS